MKKKISVLCSLAFVFCAFFGSACSSRADTAGTTNSAAPVGGTSSTSASVAANATQSYTIANVPKCVGIAWWDRMKAGNAEFEKETGNKVSQVGSTTVDASNQVKTLQNEIAQKVSAITVIPVSPEACEPILKKARSAGIVVVSHEATTLKNVDYDVEAFQNENYGAHLMDNLAKSMGEKGDYAIMVGSLTMVTHQQWSDAAIKEQKAKYPNMHLATNVVEASTQDASYSKTKELLNAYPSLKGIIGMDTLNTPGIAMAVGEAGLNGKVFVTGTCLPSTIKQYLANNSCQECSCWDPALAGRAMCTVAVKVLNKQPITDGMDLGIDGYEHVTLKDHIIYGSAWIDIDKSNVDTFGF